MDKIELKSYEDVTMYLNEINLEEINLERQIENLKCNLFNKSYKENKKKQQMLKNKLDYIKSNAEFLVSFIDNAVTFDRKLFFDFILKFLELIENKSYGVDENIADYYFPLMHSHKGSRKSVPTPLRYYYIITSVDSLSEINDYRDSTNCEVLDVNGVLELLDGEKLICLKQSNEYCLLEGTRLNPSFKCYSYLLVVAKLLIDLKIKCPKLSDKDRLNIVYLEVKKKIDEGENKKVRRV